MPDFKFAVVLEVFEQMSLVGDRWERVFKPVTVNLCRDEVEAEVSLAVLRQDNRLHNPAGNSRDYRHSWVEEYPGGKRVL